MASRYIVLATAAILFTALNLIILAANWSIQGRANVAGMDRRDLYDDREFRWAVQDVIEDCKIDEKKIKC
jgi:hypothetical protein